MLSAVYLAAWLRAFVFTQIVEVLVYHVGFKVRPLKAFGASAITHPFVWFAFPHLVRLPAISYGTIVVLAELFAWLVEAFYLARIVPMKAPKAVLASLVANGASLGLGMICRHYTGYP